METVRESNGADTTINTTMGELIEALTQVALKASKNQDEAYKLVALTVQDLLRKNNKTLPVL